MMIMNILIFLKKRSVHTTVYCVLVPWQVMIALHAQYTRIDCCGYMIISLSQFDIQNSWHFCVQLISIILTFLVVIMLCNTVPYRSVRAVHTSPIED